MSVAIADLATSSGVKVEARAAGAAARGPGRNLAFGVVLDVVAGLGTTAGAGPRVRAVVAGGRVDSVVHTVVDHVEADLGTATGVGARVRGVIAEPGGGRVQRLLVQ